MPRPCAVEAHARSYKRTLSKFADATALRRGGSRSQLQKKGQEICGCHGLAPWRLTLTATKDSQKSFRMPRPCAVETHVPVETPVLTTKALSVRLHGARPWHLE